MSTLGDTRLVVRQRANFVCEFCGVTEIDTGSELTIDHFRPRTKGGTDDLGNLLYCCVRCNQHKADYWPSHPNDLMLWNPRQEPAANHFLLLADGTLYPITPVGVFTVNRLYLNRPPLVAYRRRNYQQDEERQLLTHYREIVLVLEQFHEQQVSLLEEYRNLLAEQQRILRLLLGR
ncbi:MAG: HNH endonuclease [Caldilinea sp. CFX5]|nr:HNH endonuclease [Caldilinea sp. CFX5]